MKQVPVPLFPRLVQNQQPCLVQYHSVPSSWVCIACGYMLCQLLPAIALQGIVKVQQTDVVDTLVHLTLTKAI